MNKNNRSFADTALAIFPSREGFGWIVFDGPLSPVGWDVCTLAKVPGTSKEKNARCMKRVESLVSEYHPAAIVLEAFEGLGTRRCERVKKLCRSVVSLATMHGIPVHIVSKAQIAGYFASAHLKTRHDVATVVASHLVEIRHRLPEKRKTWNAEDADMALFNAAALLFVHYGNPKEPLQRNACVRRRQ
ncbi:MAG: hypothetical protein KGJ49_04965 [Alphaproteobacteria bacterium]|nr:hypothetical protein [Alphaproteobacteria bacterium]